MTVYLHFLGSAALEITADYEIYSVGYDKYLRMTSDVSLFGKVGGKLYHAHAMTADKDTNNSGSPRVESFAQDFTAYVRMNHAHRMQSRRIVVSPELNNPYYYPVSVVRIPLDKWEKDYKTIPKGAIVASTRNLSAANLTRLDAADGRIIKMNDPSTTVPGGRATSSHKVTGTTDNYNACTLARALSSTVLGQCGNHAHTINLTSDSQSLIPKSIDTRLYVTSAVIPAIVGMVCFVDGTPSSNWEILSSWNNRFLYSGDVDSVDTGSDTCTHANVTGYTSTQYDSTVISQAYDVSGIGSNHNHYVIIPLSTEDQIPVYFYMVPVELIQDPVTLPVAESGTSVSQKPGRVIVTTKISMPDNTQNMITNIPEVVLNPKLLQSKPIPEEISLANDQGNLTPAWKQDYAVAQGTVRMFNKNMISSEAPTRITIDSGTSGLDQGTDSLGGLDQDEFDDLDDAAKVIVTNLATVSDAVIATTAVDTTTKYLQYTMESFAGRHLLMSSSGVLHVVYRNYINSGYRACHSWSEDGGKTWETEYIDTSYLIFQSYVTAVIDGEDTLHVFWFDSYVTGDNPATNWWGVIKYAYKTKSGYWSDVYTVSNTNNVRRGNPDANISSNGVIGVVWCEEGLAPDTAAAELCYRERSAAGAWSSIVQLTSDGANDTREYGLASLDFDSDDNPRMIAASASFSPAQALDLWYLQRSAGTWSKEHAVEAAHANHIATICNIMIGSDKSVYAGYIQHDLPYTLYIRKRSPAGVWTSDASILPSSSKSCTSARLHMDSKDQLYITIETAYDLGVPGWWNAGLNYIIRYPDGTYSDPIVLKTADSSVDYTMPFTLYGKYPKVGGILQSLTEQKIILVYCKSTPAVPYSGELRFMAVANAIMGAPVSVPTYTYERTKNEGCINTNVSTVKMTKKLIS